MYIRTRRPVLSSECWKCLIPLSVVLFFVLSHSSTAQSTTVYIYDQLGRLIGVVDPTAETAVYTYDANGNILSISRHSSSQVSIIGFTPNNGPASTIVRIYGTGFSATATQDKVKFNGVQATITSASVTQIVTSVPNGATTGPITVTTPSGSASSTAPFTIGFSKSPTITGFTPNIGSSGTAVGITGTNFQTTTFSDAVRFNLTLSPVANATALSIKTSVPVEATSGRISVATQYGKATSTADFFAPPLPYVPSDVGFTGRMSSGETKTLTIGTSRKVGLMVFDAKSNHRASLSATNSTFACSKLTLSILSPGGVTLASNSMCGATGFLDTPSLTDDGTYTILAETSNGATGSVTLALYDVAHDFMGTITPGGSPVTINITTVGQNAELTFSGTFGERVSLNLTNPTFPQCSLNASIVNPDGTTLTSLSCADHFGFVDTQRLPMTGTYAILVTPTNASTGSITATLYKVPPDVTGTIVINGSSVRVNITTPGQNAELTFAGTANETATVQATNSTIGCMTIGIVNPDGTLLHSEVDCGSTFNLIQLLPVTGSYTLSINPQGANTGGMTVKITSP